MDPREMDALVQRLVQNPHDHDALSYAHQAGQADPRSYAMLLEKVGTATADSALASHWLTESAKVWADTLGDAHRAARALMIAIDRDPTQSAAADRLGELYREKGDSKALVALLERRAKALAPLAQQDADMRAHVAGIHEELGRLWSEPPLTQPKKAVENFRRALDYDPSSQYAIYSVREALKQQGAWAEAVPYFGMELSLVDDPERQVALYRDEADVRKKAGDPYGAADALRHARNVDQDRDPALKQELASLLLERVQQGESLHPQEAQEGAQLFVALAEEYPGEHAYSYSTCALELDPANDRAIQLALYYAEQLGRQHEVAPKAAAYLKANPGGAIVEDARRLVTDAVTSESASGSELVEALAPPADAPNPDRVRGLLDVADALARKGKKQEAAQRYREILEIDPANPDALGFLEGHLRQARKYGDLRDVLMAAARTSGVDSDARRGWLREIAGLCETQLRDMDNAIYAWKQLAALDRSEEGPRTQLRRLLEKAQRWDDLATLLEQDAEQTTDLEARLSMEKQLAKLHEQKRKDPVAAGEAWGRIASLAPGDDSALSTAVKLFERGERPDLAAQCIADNIAEVEEGAARTGLQKRLGELREAAGDLVAAGDAFAEAAASADDARLWQSAERCFVAGQVWDQAANAVGQRAQLTDKPKDKAELFALEADYVGRAGDEASAVLRLEQAADLDPTNESHAKALEERYESAARTEDLVRFLLRRAEQLPQAEQRVALRKRAASMQREVLSDADGARETWLAILSDGDDAETLELLAEDAETRSEFGEAAEYLHRLAKSSGLEDARRMTILLREAQLVAEGLDDKDGAVERYEHILSKYDDKNLPALDAIAALHEQRDDAKGQADALERRLALTEAGDERMDVAQRLASLYEGPLDDPRAALRILDIIRGIDEEDFDALQRACDIAERLEDWPRVAEHLAALSEVEGDDEELSRMTRKLATIQAEQLEKGDEALATLMEVADQGDEACREAYVELGDKLGWSGIVATKLVQWHLESPVSPERHIALRGAFTRFVDVGRDSDAAQVAQEIVRTRGADQELATRLEEIAIKLKDVDALGVAHDFLVQDLSGASRAEEMVRQAETLVSAGVDPIEAINHGEQALTSVGPDEVEPLLERLSKLAPAPGHVIDLYERQIVRCKAPEDRLNALGRAARIAAVNDSLERARAFFDLALSGGVQDATLEALEDVARTTDQSLPEPKLLGVLCEALAAGGQGSRDGGRTRSALLRRSAQLAHRDLGDIDRAFRWIGDALVTHVDDDSLDALEALAEEVGDLARAQTVLSRALDEVFDGPLVRKLLARRAAMRRDKLSDKVGAAQDLKRLHDLSPSDAGISNDLAQLYQDLEDWRGMVQLYEDQILRGKDPSARAEMARKVARLWEERLDDPREAADAWRRVLRMKSGDPEGTEGLERSKAAMIGRAKEPKPAPKPEPKSEPKAAAPVIAEQEPQLTEPEASPEPLPTAAVDELFAPAADDEAAEDDGPTLPPKASEPTAQAEAEAALSGLKPERPDIQFPTADEITVSASITEMSSEDEFAAPAADPAAPPPPGATAAVPDFGADEEYDRTWVQPGLAEELAGKEGPATVDDEELIVDDEELFEEEP